MNICYTALFGNYEELKPVKTVTLGWKYICYTDQPLTSDVWEIVQVDLNGEDPQRVARWYKIMHWVDWERSIWIDASFIIDTDLNEWWSRYFAKGFSVPAHPLRNCWYVECLDCIISGRGNKEQVQSQLAEYEAAGLPRNNGVIQSGLLMRENTQEVINLCERWYLELSKRSLRDQIAFCRVSLGSEVVNMYQFDYRMEKDFIYKKHFRNR